MAKNYIFIHHIFSVLSPINEKPFSFFFTQFLCFPPFPVLAHLFCIGAMIQYYSMLKNKDLSTFLHYTLNNKFFHLTIKPILILVPFFLYWLRSLVLGTNTAKYGSISILALEPGKIFTIFTPTKAYF